MTRLPIVRILSSLLPEPAAAEPVRETSGRGVLLRIVDTIAHSNRRRAEREIARFLARKGGRINVEREIASFIARNGGRTGDHLEPDSARSLL